MVRAARSIPDPADRSLSSDRCALRPRDPRLVAAPDRPGHRTRPNAARGDTGRLGCPVARCSPAGVGLVAGVGVPSRVAAVGPVGVGGGLTPPAAGLGPFRARKRVGVTPQPVESIMRPDPTPKPYPGWPWARPPVPPPTPARAPRGERPRCGARTRTGRPCRAPKLWRVGEAEPRPRCRMHGGASTGPRTAEGAARVRLHNVSAANRAALAEGFPEMPAAELERLARDLAVAGLDESPAVRARWRRRLRAGVAAVEWRSR